MKGECFSFSSNTRLRSSRKVGSSSLAGRPAWLLPVMICAAVTGVVLLIRWTLLRALPGLRSWRGRMICALQSAFVSLVLCSCSGNSAIIVAELSSQQNIIAVAVDDSRSMAIADSEGNKREDAATAALDSGVLVRTANSASRRAHLNGIGV